MDEFFPSGAVQRDLFYLFVGKKLGKGITREVFECQLNPEYVIKAETEGDWFQNTMEWRIWDEVRYTEFAKWFAPCVEISLNGIYLIQKRTYPIPKAKQPKQIPAFFRDTKLDNWGLYKNHPVCHDYGLHNLIQKGLTKRLIKARW